MGNRLFFCKKVVREILFEIIAMKLLFIHDHPFFRENDDVYSGGSFPASVWKNYTFYFDIVNVYARLSKDEKSKVTKSSTGENNLIFNLTNNYSSISKLLFNFNFIKNDIKEKIFESDITVVRLPSILGFISGVICIRNKKPFVVEQVGSSKENYLTNGSLNGKIISQFAEKLNQYIVRKSPYVYYVTKNKLQNEYPTPGHTTSISNVILEKLITKEQIDICRFQNTKIKIGLIGGFEVSYKGQDVLLKAISNLDANLQQNIELYLVGIGHYDWVIKLADSLGLLSNIKFIGSIQSGKAIFDFLSKLSLYVQPSFTEGMPRGMLEAMSMGCPVIGSNAGGIADIVEDRFLHQPGDYKTLGKQIEEFYLDRELLIKESKRSIETVKPYLKENLDAKRKIFYTTIVNDIKKEKGIRR